MAKKGGPRTTPSTTSVTPSTTSSTLTKFSLKKFAHLFRTLDSHTLRIYETETGKCTTRWSGASTATDEKDELVGSLQWLEIVPLSREESSSAAEGRGKKRRKDGAEEDSVKSISIAESKIVLGLGLQNGSILLLPPNSATPIIISSPNSTLEIIEMNSPGYNHLWTLSIDGSIRVWDLESQTLIATVAGLEEGAKWDDLKVKYDDIVPGSKKYSVQVILTHLTIHIFSTSLAIVAKKDKIKEIKLVEVGKCSGHVTPCTTLFTLPLADAPNALQFLSYSKSDRFINFYSLPSSSTSPKLIARLGLATPVHTLTLSTSFNQLSAVDSEGKISIVNLPSTSTSSKIVELPVESTIAGIEGGAAGVLDLELISENELVICRGSLKPVFEVVEFKNENGWIKSIELEKSGLGLLNGASSSSATPNLVRYTELAASTVRTGSALGEAGSDDEMELENNGELDVEMAEPTLAERLKSLKVGKVSTLAIASGAEEVEEVEEEEDEEEGLSVTARIPSTTLTTSLIQALHSSDTPLLESCLIHSNPTLIRSTVKRLNSGTLVLTLLEVLVEKLGKAKSGKGVNGGSISSVKRARGLIEWVRQVLIVHVGFLVTIPSLVNRLSTLHASLTSRLALQPTLQALNGRLELVMSQIELRQEKVAVTSTARSAAKGKAIGTRYVEGESSEGEAGSNSEEEDEFDSEEEGSIEDVILGSDRSDEEMEEEDDEDAAKTNGRIGSEGLADLLDLEASEEEGEEEDDSEEGDSESDEE